MIRTSKVWMLKNLFEGEPKLSDFELEEHELRDITDGELICEAEYLSVDPYMRVYVSRIPSIPATMIGTQVAKVIESKNPSYPVGSYIYGHFGWRSRTLVTALDDPKVHPIKPYPCPNLGTHPRSYALGCCGRVGNSAYFGLLELCKPQPGETVVISGAAGAVGCLVGQIAKIKGCKVIGIAGGIEKCNWLTNELGFDEAVDYKDEKFNENLSAVTLDGVDVYFDNVGGIISYEVMKRMNQFGRISICGSISSYNLDPSQVPKVPQINDFHRKILRMEGFLVNRWLGERWFEGIMQIKTWLDEGKIKYKETITEGFENMPQAFIDVLRGKNFGKAIVKV
ncbi:prostaglandin reductase 1-like [Bradysia coprophila]|uniref:prostaglandin reductase 1-like n=1 Tax=Bradysia coprophila TaxID=38358 RepID=UPI00187DB52B|nr:prostaglandin reductase 1-like [Bradysia coprophila]